MVIMRLGYGERKTTLEIDYHVDKLHLVLALDHLRQVNVQKGVQMKIPQFSIDFSLALAVPAVKVGTIEKFLVQTKPVALDFGR